MWPKGSYIGLLCQGPALPLVVSPPPQLTPPLGCSPTGRLLILIETQIAAMEGYPAAS